MKARLWRNPAEQGKNLKCPAGEGKTIRNPVNKGEIQFYLIKYSKIPPLLLIQSWILCSKFWTVDRSTCLGIFLQLLMIRCIIFSLVGKSAYAIFFKKPHRKKSELIRTGDLRHHSTWSRIPIHLQGNRQCKNCWTILFLWVGALSCWNHIRCLVCRAISSKRFDN